MTAPVPPRPPAPRSRPSWLVPVLVALGIIAMAMIRDRQDDSDRLQLPYSAMLARIEQGALTEATITQDGRTVTGTLATPLDTLGRSVARVVSAVPPGGNEDLLERLLADSVRVSAASPPRSFFGTLLSIAPLIILIAFGWILLRTAGAAGRTAFSFGKSGNRLVSETPTIRFADVAGADEAKGELQEIIDFLRDPARFTRLGGRLPKGALLVGPPGTGKTLLARAVAGEAERPFFSMSGSDFVEMFVGVGASRVRDLFKQAREQAPCIVFIDEIDAVARHRGAGMGGGNDEREQTLNQLLVEMDGFDASLGLIVIAATNRPDVLDAAIRRPGRFDREVHVGLPDTAGREAILRVHTARVPLASDIDLHRVARGTPGMSGAELANLVNEAALMAARRHHEAITLADLEDARDKLLLGLERRSLVLSDMERRLTAYHEAGHALVGLLIPGSDPLHKVTIVPRGSALGITASLPDVDRHTYTRRWLQGHLRMLYGGRAAEEIILGADDITTGAQNDIVRATGIARRMVTVFGMSPRLGPMAVDDEASDARLGGAGTAIDRVAESTREAVDSEVRRILDTAMVDTLALLREHQRDLDTLAQALLERETLSRDDVLALLPHLHPAPTVDPHEPPALG